MAAGDGEAQGRTREPVGGVRGVVTPLLRLGETGRDACALDLFTLTRRLAAMSLRLKPVHQQTIVITGASSGIGLTTARMAAKGGARLVLAARSEDALARLVDELGGEGNQAAHVVADVTRPDDVRAIAERAQEAFGGFDTWVNNAGVSIYGRLDEVPVEDMRKLFDTNVWGVVYGSLEAARHLKTRGGALINIGSVLSDRAILLQGAYSASKHAVKGFTDALRMELENEGAPVSVTLVKPSAINTPYPEHAKNYMDRAATVPPPVYAPEVVARAILHAAAHPQRDVIVGGGGKQMSAMGYYAPGLMDTVMEKVFAPMQKRDAPPLPLERNGLDGPSGTLDAHGSYDGHVLQSSVYTQAVQHPWKALLGAGAVGLAVALAQAARR
jgi:short-subunit dehydrogenase